LRRGPIERGRFRPLRLNDVGAGSGGTMQPLEMRVGGAKVGLR